MDIAQSDFAFTMSLLLGLPAPADGVGRPIAHIRDLLKNEEDLAAAFLRAAEILDVHLNRRGIQLSLGKD